MQYNEMRAENASENKRTFICCNCRGLEAGKVLHLSLQRKRGLFTVPIGLLYFIIKNSMLALLGIYFTP